MIDAELKSLLAYVPSDFINDVALQDRLFAYIWSKGYNYVSRKSCNSCIARAYNALNLEKNKQLNQKEIVMPKYTMKKGIRYRPPNWDIILSADNCTQELAEKCLKRNPSTIIYFDVEEMETPKKEPKPKTKRKKKEVDNGNTEVDTEQHTPTSER